MGTRTRFASSYWASPSCHRKQISHCSLIRMLCCPARSPPSASSLLFGGTRRSSRICALFSIRSFLRATCWISVGSLLDRSPRQTFSVSKHYAPQPARQPGVDPLHGAPNEVSHESVANEQPVGS